MNPSEVMTQKCMHIAVVTQYFILTQTVLLSQHRSAETQCWGHVRTSSKACAEPPRVRKINDKSHPQVT